jgi:ribulose-bisphosphate carboxylase large chain
LHVNGLANKFSETDGSVIASARACLEPLHAGDPRVVPVFSSAQTVLQVEATYRALGSADLIYASGGGIMAHPDGIGGGCTALWEAWEAAMSGVPLAAAAARSRALARAIETFSGKIRPIAL